VATGDEAAALPVRVRTHVTQAAVDAPERDGSIVRVEIAKRLRAVRDGWEGWMEI